MNKAMREYENLCTLGLPSRELVQLAVVALERMIGGSLFGFLWANARYEAEDAYVLNPVPDAYTRIYAEEFYNRREAEVGPTFTEILRDRIPLVNFTAFGRRMFRSALYGEVFQPLGMRHALRVSVIDGEHRHGLFAITRGDTDRPFTPQELKQLLHAARYLAHGFELERTGALVRGDAIDGPGEGFLLLDAGGTLLHGCDVGLRLFYEATRADGLAQQPAATRETLPAALVARAAHGGVTGELVLTNRRGAFVFRPLLLRPADGCGAAPVAVRVRRRGSLAARLWQEAQRFGLSARERQTAVLLATGEGYDHIATRLRVSRNTAVSYVRRTYEKLGTNQREQLLRVLLS